MITTHLCIELVGALDLDKSSVFTRDRHGAGRARWAFCAARQGQAPHSNTPPRTSWSDVWRQSESSLPFIWTTRSVGATARATGGQWATEQQKQQQKKLRQINKIQTLPSML